MAILPLYQHDSDGEAEDEPIKRRDFAAAGESAPTTTLSLRNDDHGQSESEDSDVEFEQVGGEADLADAPKLKQVEEDQGNIEIILEKAPVVESKLARGKGKGRPGLSGIERKIRLETHKFHLLCLVIALVHRNQLLNDDLLQARLLSLVPLHIQNAFTSYNPTTQPNPRDRSRLFDAAIRQLVSWWYRTFTINLEIENLQTKTYAEAALEKVPYLPQQDREKLSDAQRKEIPGDLIRNAQSLMKRAVLLEGSRDMSPQLFVALCRAMDVPARLVISLQPLDWRAAGSNKINKKATLINTDTATTDGASDSASASTSRKMKKKKVPQSGIAKVMKKAGLKQPISMKAKGKAKEIEARITASTTASEDVMEEDSDDNIQFEPIASSSKSEVKPSKDTASRPVSVSGGSTNGDVRGAGFMQEATTEESETERLRQAGPAPKLRRTKLTGKKATDFDRSPSPDISEQHVYPTMWAEVYSRSNKEWIPVDPTRKLMRCSNKMEPPKTHKHNKMIYVVAIEQDNSVRDVTLRYVEKYGAVTLKARAPNTTHKSGIDWWDNLLSTFSRKFELDRDRAEAEQLLRSKSHEGLPAQISGYKDHPLFVLERHLKREEWIWPRKQIGTMRDEAVFPRANVIEVKSAEQYMREGLKIKEGEQPLKYVKSRAMTINRRRANELAIAEGREEDTMQGLYARWQTLKAVPPPIQDGKIPKNSYGNLDLFAPHMLPKGAAHLPYKGIAKIAKSMSIDFAEAVTGFEFHKRRAIPSVEGIVVAEENADVLLDAFWASEHAASEKAFTKKQERCLKRWKMIITGLAIRNRLQLEYAKKAGKQKPSTSTSSPVQKAPKVEEASQFRQLEEDDQVKVIGHRKSTVAEQPMVNNALPSLKLKVPARSVNYLAQDTSSDEEDREEGKKEDIDSFIVPDQETDQDSPSPVSSVKKKRKHVDGSDSYSSEEVLPVAKKRSARSSRGNSSTKESKPSARPSRAAKSRASKRLADEASSSTSTIE